MVILSERRLQAAAFTLFVLAGVAAARDSFTLEQVLSAPFPTELVASPTGSRALMHRKNRFRVASSKRGTLKTG